jgi:hypothetical protein
MQINSQAEDLSKLKLRDVRTTFHIAGLPIIITKIFDDCNLPKVIIGMCNTNLQTFMDEEISRQ